VPSTELSAHGVPQELQELDALDGAASIGAAQKPVQVKLNTSDLAILAGGVNAGEQVVTEGQNQLRPGAKIAVRPAK